MDVIKKIIRIEIDICYSYLQMLNSCVRFPLRTLNKMIKYNCILEFQLEVSEIEYSISQNSLLDDNMLGCYVNKQMLCPVKQQCCKRL